MTIYKQEDLVSFLNQTIEKSGLSRRGFASLLHAVDPRETALDTSILSRLLSPTGTTQAPRESTLRKLAKIVLRRADATIEQLWDAVYQLPTVPTRDSTLRIGTGFTCWSSFVVHMISESDTFPKGISFVFCAEIITDTVTGEDRTVPYYISKPADIDGLRDPDRRISRRFGVNELRDMIDSGELDCVLMLRTSFERIALQFNQRKEVPLLHCRIAVGHGTHLYVVRVKELVGATPTEPTPQTLLNESMDLSTFDKRMVAYERFLDQINGKRIRTVTLGNSTVGQHYDALMERERVNPKHVVGGKSEIYIDSPEDDRLLDAVAAQMLPIGNGPTIDVFMIVAFEPITNIVFNKLARLFKRKQEEAYPPLSNQYSLIYTNYNVARMVSDKSAYCLYSQVEVIDDPDRLIKTNQLLNALNKYVIKNGPQLNTKVSTALADIYYPDADETADPTSNLTRMLKALEELEFTNHALPFIDRVTNLVDRISHPHTLPGSADT